MVRKVIILIFIFQIFLVINSFCFQYYKGPTVIEVETEEQSNDPILAPTGPSIIKKETTRPIETKGIKPTRKPKIDENTGNIIEEEYVDPDEIIDTYYKNTTPAYGENGFWGPGMIINISLRNKTPQEELDNYWKDVYQGLGIDKPEAKPKEYRESDNPDKIIPIAPEKGEEYYKTITAERLYKDFIWEHNGSNNTWKLRKGIILDNYKDTDPKEEYFTGWQRIPYTEKIYDMWRYFDPETKIMSIGWKKVNLITNKDKTAWFFFHPIIGCMQRGWLKYDNKLYYLVSDDTSELYGSMLEGFWQIDDKVYYFERNSGEKTFEISVNDAIKFNIDFKKIK